MTQIKTLQAMGKHVIVKPIYPEKKNLIITSKEETPIAWEVISAGKDVDLLVGQPVFIAPYGVQEMAYNNEKYYVCQLENIYAKETIDIKL